MPLTLYFFGEEARRSNLMIFSSKRFFNFNLKTININHTLTHIFSAKNIGNKALTIKFAESNCDCTIIDYAQKSIQKGDEAEIKVQFVPKNKGNIERNIVFEANTIPSYTVLSLAGEVK